MAKAGIPHGQLVAGALGVVVIGALHVATPFNFTGYGPHGVDWLTYMFSAFWFGLVGFGGGMLVYRLLQRRGIIPQDTDISN